MFEAGLPISIRVQKVEFVFAFAVVAIAVVMQLVFGLQGRSGNNQISTGLVKSYRIKRGGNAKVGYKSSVVAIPAITFRRNIHNKADVEVGLVFQYGLSIFGNLAIELFGGVIRTGNGSAKLAEGDALAAADAIGVVDFSLVSSCIDVDGVMGAVSFTDAAANAAIGINFRISWPLKWFMEIIISASAKAVPIFGALQYSPLIAISR